MEANVAGIPLDWRDEGGDNVFPLAALVIFKAVDKDGEEVHAIVPTEGLTEVDALGMAHYAVLYAEDQVRQTIYDNRPTEKESSSSP